MSQSLRFPDESEEYRAARDRLLRAEAELRASIEEVAALRRRLPPGGPVLEDYVFDEIDAEGVARQVQLSDLFGAHPSLVLYSYMFGPEMAEPCPYCTSLIDGFDGAAPHIERGTAFAVVAKSPIARIEKWRRERGWQRVRLLSSAGNSYNADYHGENAEGAQMPMVNVFAKTDDGIVHSWASELLGVPMEGADPRHVDLLWPVWNILDLTPQGRGDVALKLRYEDD